MNDAVTKKPDAKPSAPRHVVKNVRKLEALIQSYRAERNDMMQRYARTHGDFWSEHAERFSLQEMDERIDALVAKVEARMEEYDFTLDFGKSDKVKPKSTKQTETDIKKLMVKREKLQWELENNPGLPDEKYTKELRLKELNEDINELHAIYASKQLAERDKKKPKGELDFAPDVMKASTVITPEDLRQSDFDFRTTFEGSIKNWAQDYKISLNSVMAKLDFKTETEKKLATVKGAVGIANTVLSKLGAGGVVAGAISVAATNTMVTVIAAALGDNLNANTTALVDVVADLEKHLNAGVDKYVKSDHGRELRTFLEEYQAKYPLRDAADKHVWLKDFHNACSKYADVNLPSSDQIAKLFIEELVAATLKALGESAIGELKIDITWDGSEGMDQFLSVRTSVSSGLPPDQFAMLKRYNKGKRVTDMDADINIRVETLANGREIFRAYRSLDDAKNEEFRMVKGGHQKTFDLFLKKKPWRDVLVGDL